MIRIILFIALGYVGFRFFKSWLLKNVTLSQPGRPDHASGDIEDTMVQDPVCKVYFPKRSGVHLHHRGKDLYFCSAECRQRFIEKL